MLVGMLMGLAASACWALANVAIQRASRGVGALRALLWAQLLGGVLVAAFAIPFDQRTGGLTAGLAGWLAVGGVAALGAYVCLFYAFEHGRLTVAVPIMSAWAVLAAALAVGLFGERLRPAQLVGAVVVIAGAVVVSRYAHREARDAGPVAVATSVPVGAAPRPRWLLASLGAAIGFGILIPIMGQLAPLFGSIGSVGVVYGADILLGVPLALALRVPLGPPSGAAWWPVFLAGLFETAGFVCITLGARFAPLAIVSPFASLAAAITVLYAWVVLRERPPRGILVGAALVCAGVLVLAL